MVNHIPDATGWISEAGTSVPHILTPHASIAFLAILAIALMIGELVRNPANKGHADEDDWD